MKIVCGFQCMKRALYGVNLLYILVGVVLIFIAAYIKTVAIITSHPIIDGIIAIGCFLILVGVFGIQATSKHHQVLLFFYMVILSCVFIIQLCITIACLSLVSPVSVSNLVVEGWHNSLNETIWDAEKYFNCCGLKIANDGYRCEELECFPDCNTCQEIIGSRIYSKLAHLGGFGLFFSFLDLVGIVFAVRYRNLKDPKLDPVLYFQQQN